MLKNLWVSAVLSALLFGRPCVAIQQQGSTHPANDNAHQSQRPSPPTQAVSQPVVVPEGIQSPSSTKDDGPKEKLLPRFLRSEWIIVYVTLAYALISWFSLRAIKRQADIMKEQSDILREKERARIDIKAGTLSVDTLSPKIFHLKTFVSIRNIGGSRAFLLKNGATFKVGHIGEAVPDQDLWYDFDIEIPNGFIEPDTATAPLCPSVFHFPENIELSDMSAEFWEAPAFGSNNIALLGFIEYETLGIKWHHDFCYKWASYKSGVVYAMTGHPEPTADVDRLTAGRWVKDEDRPNGEYEIGQPQTISPVWRLVREWYRRVTGPQNPN